MRAAATPRPMYRFWWSSWIEGGMGLRGSNSTEGQLHLIHFGIGLLEITGQFNGYWGVSQSQVAYTGQNFVE